MFQLEEKGIPTTAVCFQYWDVCAACAKDARNFGMANYPWVEVPIEYGIPYDRESMVKAVEDVVADGIIAALTTRLEYLQNEAIKEQILSPGGDRTPTSETMTFSGSDYAEGLEKFQQAFDAWGLAGGFIVIPPTKERVEAMLEGTGHSSDEVITNTMDLNEATVKKVAINAVMAGCEPAHLPVVLAIVRAEAQSRADNALMFLDSPLALVNGPVRNELKIISGMPGPASGAAARVNLAISRAIRLIGMNVAGYWSGRMPVIVAEMEEGSPWEPYHVEMGYDANASTVTVLPMSYSAPTSLYTGSVADQKPTCKEVMYVIARGMRGLENYPTYSALPSVLPWSDTVVMLGKEPAKRIADDGWTKKDIREYLWRETGIYAGDLKKGASPMLQYWSRFNKGIYDMDDDVLTPLVANPDNLHIFVTDEGTGAYFWQGPFQGRIFTEVIDDWK
jgi:hypothetical protein